MMSVSSIITDLILHKNIRIIIGQGEDYKTSKTNRINDFYYHPAEPNDWIHTLQPDRLLPKTWDMPICLNNQDTLAEVIRSVDQIKTNKIISISQADNSHWCNCPQCEKEAPSETLIRFVNNIASRYPNKKFSTLAYFRTEEPPKTKPLPNVQVIITTIELPKDEAYKTSRRSDVVSWRKRLAGWRALTPNIVVWDYYSNFRHLLMPYPVLLSIGKNIRWFYRMGISNFIMQTNAGTGHEFSELKSHLISEMMWNPIRRPKTVIDSFLSTYYGPAAPEIRKYIYLLEKKQSGGYHLINWSDPKEFTNSFLSRENLADYKEILGHSLSCSQDPAIRLRVETILLQVLYTLIELNQASEPESATFRRICERLGGVMVNENNLTYDKYLKQKGL